jgi:hypothetical protein
MLILSFLLGMLTTLVLLGGLAYGGGKYVARHPEVIAKKAAKVMFGAPGSLHK